MLYYTDKMKQSYHIGIDQKKNEGKEPEIRHKKDLLFYTLRFHINTELKGIIYVRQRYRV